MCIHSNGIDDYKVRHVKRADGAIYSFTSLITNISPALIGGLITFAPSAIGYVPNAQQYAETIQGLNTVVNLLPGIIYLLAAVPMLFYGITKAKVQGYAKEIEERCVNANV